jgi:PKD repeat protein
MKPMLKQLSLLIFFCFVTVITNGQPNNLQTPDCNAQFLSFPDNQNPMKIHFRDQSLGLIFSWQWSFGDGFTSSIQNPDHVYASGGTYFVCLTIYTDIGNCHDVLCQAITVHQPGTCVADYHYAVSPGNILEYHFEDQSSGPVDRWHWNFGDGTTAEQKDPFHIFPSQGNYAVCLTTWKNDSMAQCQDTKCDTIRIVAPVPCIAKFVSQLDSMNHQPRMFQFASTSTGSPNQHEWRFGDGTGATGEPTARHQYKSPGTYKVCLLVMRKSGGTVWCSDSVCQMVTVPEYYNLGGHLFAGSVPINNPVSTGDTGIAFLYKFRGSGVVPYDTSFFTYLGYYAFTNLLSGDYLMKAALTSGSEHYKNYIPAYFPNTVTWSQSAKLTIRDSNEFHSHVTLLDLPQGTFGDGSISGAVFQGEPVIGGTPEPHAEVILYNEQLTPVDFTSPDYSGAFSFTGLPYGLYYLYAEKTGMYSRYSAVWLDEKKPLADSVLIGVFDHDVTGIDGRHGNDGIQLLICPNPVTDQFSLKIRTRVPGTLQIRISDLFGRILFETLIIQNNPESIADLDGAIFKPGVYLVVVNDSKGNRITRKLIRL